MREAKQETRVKDIGWMTTFTAIEANHTASWTRFGDDGVATFDAQLHRRAGWLSLTMFETYTKKRTGGKRDVEVSRQTMMSLEPKSAKALYEFLKAEFEPAFTPADDLLRRKADAEERDAKGGK